MNLKKIAIASSVIAGITMALTCHAVTVTATHTVESDAEFTIDWVDAGPTTTNAKDGEVWGHLDMTQTRGTPTLGRLSNPQGETSPGPLKAPFRFAGPNGHTARAYLDSYGTAIHNYAGDNLANGLKVGSGTGDDPFVVGTTSRLTAKIFGDQTLVPGVYRTTFELTTWTD